MHRFFILILSFLYLGTSMGAGFNLHYCMGKLVETSFFANNRENCSKCGMEKNTAADNDCCKDEHQHVKVQDDHKAASLLLPQLQPHGAAMVSPHYMLPEVVITSSDHQVPQSHGPPLGSATGFYILHCSFLI